MAKNFAFQPFGLSQAITVGSTPSTVSFSVVAVGTTVTTALTGGNYIPGCVRLAVEGTASVFVNFAASGTVSVTVTNGMRILQNTDRVINTGGLPFMAAMCASTFTVTMTATLGEGIGG